MFHQRGGEESAAESHGWPRTNASADIKITPRPNEPVSPRRPVERNEQTCLRQERFAVLLARAMELKLVEQRRQTIA